MASTPSENPPRRFSPRLAAKSTPSGSGSLGPSPVERKRLSYGSCEGEPASAKRKTSSTNLEEEEELITMGSILDTDPGCVEAIDGEEEEDEEEDEGEEEPAHEFYTHCCVPVCLLGNLIDTRNSQHQCRTCGNYFHAPCAFAYSGSDDMSDCGCQKAVDQAYESRMDKSKQATIEKADGKEEVGERVELHKWQEAPKGFNDLQRRVWLDSVDLNGKHRKAPTFANTPELVALWKAGRKARKDAKKKTSKKNRLKGC